MTSRRFEFGDEPRNGSSPHEPASGPEGGAYVRDLWNFLRRNRLIILTVPLLALGAAVLATRQIRPVYEAETTIRIDEERSAVPILDVLKTLSSGGSGIGTEMQVLRSRTLAEAVIDSLRLQVRLLEPRAASRDALVRVDRVERTAVRQRYEIESSGADRFEVRRRGQSQVLARIAPGETVRVDGLTFELLPAALEADKVVIGVERYDDVLRSVRRRLVVGRPSRDADIVEARFQDTDRALVAAVPNVLADRFIAFRARDRSQESTSTIRFLGAQLDEIAGQLRMAESELQQFRERTGVISLDAEARANIAGLGELKANRDALAAEAAALQRVVAEIGRPSATGAVTRDRSVLAFPTLLRIPAAAQLMTSLVDLEDQRAARLQLRRPEDPEIQMLDARIREVEAEIASIGRTYAQGLNEQVASLDRTLGQFRTELQQVPAREITFAGLRRRVEGLEEIYTALHTTLKEQEVLAAVEDGSIRVIDPAALPTRPVRPNLPLTMALSLLVGGVLAVGAAFVREQVDTAVHTREELQQATRGVPLLGTIPRIRAPARANGRLRRGNAPVTVERLVAANDPHSPAAEAYRTLRTSIAFSRAGSAPSTLVFTSPLPGDGKSTSASNYAITLARQGARCIIVDADMRRGTLHGVFGIAKEPGLSNVLLGRTAAADAVQQVSIDDVSVAVLTGGVTPPNPAELLGSAAMATLIEELAAEYDAVVIDAPPLNLVTDAALVGVHADGVILVARAGVTERAAVSYAMEQLRGVRARVLGTILNDSGDGRERYYGSYVPDAEPAVTR